MMNDNMEKLLASKIVIRYEGSNKSDNFIKEGNMSLSFVSFKEYNKDSNFKYRIDINYAGQ